MRLSDKRVLGLRFTRRSLLKWIGIGAAGAYLAGCAPQATPTAPAAAKPAEATTAPTTPAKKAEEEVEIRHSTKQSGEGELHLLKDFAAKYEEKHPGVTVKLEPPAGGLHHFQKFLTDLAAGDPPDTYLADDYNVASLAVRDALAPLDDYIAVTPELDTDDYFQPTFAACSWRGKTWALPFYYFSFVLFYNKDMFDEAGVDYPPADFNDKSWTFDKMLETARKLTKKDSGGKITQYGYMWDYAYLSRYSSHIYAWGDGAQIVDDKGDPAKCTLAEEASVAALQFLQDLRTVHEVSPYPAAMAAAKAEGNNVRYIMAGKLAMGVGGTWGTVSMAATDLNWDVAPLPRSNRDGSPGTAVATNTYIMAAAAKHHDLAWDWMATMGGKEFITERATRPDLQHVPGRTSVVPKWLALGPPPEHRHVITDTGQYGTRIITFSDYPQLQDIILKGSEAIWLGTEPAAKVTAEICDKVNELLAKAK